MTPRRRTVVVGSVNADLSVRVAAFPRAGETVSAASLMRSTGGKGANAAVAAARLGADVLMIGAVGDDQDGRAARARLTAAGIDCGGVVVHDAAPTGLALITVNSFGENFIEVLAGANQLLRPTDVADKIPGEASVMLLSLELPDEPLAAAAAQRAQGGTVILNLSPARACDPVLVASADILLVNEHELRAAYGTWPRSDAEWHDACRGLGTPVLVVTLGAAGAIAVGPPGIVRAPGIPVDVVDTTGCGDAFAGALAARLASGSNLAEAVLFGTRVGAYAATIAGTQSSYPTQADLDEWLYAGGMPEHARSASS